MCKGCAQERDIQIKIEEKREVENFIDDVEAYFQLTSSDKQKGVRELNEDFKKQTYNRQTTSCQVLCCMSISEHSNGLVSIIEFKRNRKNKTNASTTIISLFIFLSKPNIIIATPVMQH